jgi:hypothetical protein
MAESTDPASARSQVSDAVLSAVRGGLRILGGMVQIGTGVTKLLAVTALKAAEAAEAVVAATVNEDSKPDLTPKAE